MCNFFFGSPNLLGWDGTNLKNSISPYPGQLGKMLNVLCYLLLVATQQVCKFSLAGCWQTVVPVICLRTIEGGNQLGTCFIWDITMENCVRA